MHTHPDGGTNPPCQRHLHRHGNYTGRQAAIESTNERQRLAVGIHQCNLPQRSNHHQTSPPTNQHPVFYRPDDRPVAQPTVSKHWRELCPLTAIFPGEPGLAGFIEANDHGSGGDNWSYKWCNYPVKSSPPTNRHPTFTSRMPFLSPNQHKTQ